MELKPLAPGELCATEKADELWKNLESETIRSDCLPIREFSFSCFLLAVGVHAPALMGFLQFEGAIVSEWIWSTVDNAIQQ